MQITNMTYAVVSQTTAFLDVSTTSPILPGKMHSYFIFNDDMRKEQQFFIYIHITR